MRRYEVLYIIRPDRDQEAIVRCAQQMKEVVEQHGGEVEEIKDWGRRRLAYEVDRVHEGQYVLMTFQGETETLEALDRQMKLSEDILRHMITRKEAA
ncbi:MAG: 30S ribosomal protein S6 [Firmicutes bacterium]|nr:30S ribosomal protein S6 [Bacillota bacterium]